MKHYQVAVIVGSLRKDSLNRKLSTAIVKLGPVDFNFKPIEFGGLPHYNQDDEANPPETVERLRAELAASQGILFVTPEFNRSIPGALKNVIDQGSRPTGHNLWAGKPTGILGISPGAPGTSMAQQHLRNILAAMDAPILGQPEAFLQHKEGFFDNAGDLGEASKTFLQGWMDKYVAWVKKFAQPTEAP